MKNLFKTSLIVAFTLLFALSAYSGDSAVTGTSANQNYLKSVVTNLNMLKQAVRLVKESVDNKNQIEIDFYQETVINIIKEDIRLTTSKLQLDKNKNSETGSYLKTKKELYSSISNKAEFFELRYRLMNEYMKTLNDEAETYRVKVASK
jgi:hypothetical protein